MPEELPAASSPRLLRALRESAECEARGDVAGALAVYEAVPEYAYSGQIQRLRTMAAWGDDAPGWLWSRYLTCQASRGVGELKDRPNPALGEVLDALYDPYLDDFRIPDGMSPHLFVVSCHQREWAVRQLTVYDHGGLARLVERVSPQLLARADRITQWSRAPPSGWQLTEASEVTGTLFVRDLASGRLTELLDLGVGERYESGQALIGRVVPISTDPGNAFEAAPLAVDPETARLVADRGRRPWLDVLAERRRAGVLAPLFSYTGDESLVSDLGTEGWFGFLLEHQVEQLPVREDGKVDLDDVGVVACWNLLRGLTVDPTLGRGMRAQISTLLLERTPGTFDRFVRPQYAATWRALAGDLLEPARTLCLRQAERSERRAAS